MNHEPTEGDNRAMSREEYQVINERTGVPLAWAAALIVACASSFAGGAVWINSGFQEMKQEFKNFRYELTDIKREMATRQTRDSLEIWIIKFRAENPSLKVPELK